MRDGTGRLLARSRSPWALGLLGLLAAYGLVRASGPRVGDADLHVYLAGAKSLLRADGSLYTTVVHGDLAFTYPPFAALVFVPLTWLPDRAAGVVFTVGSLAAAGYVLWVLGRRAGSAVPGALVPVALVVLAGEPLLRNLGLGQINLYLIAMVTADLLVVPARYRGFLIGVATGIKLTPAVFLVQFVLRRDWASLARGVCGIAVTVLVGWWADPVGSRYYLGGGALGLGKFGDTALVRPDNQSLTGVLLRALHATALPVPLQVAAVLVPVAIGAWIARRRLVAEDRLGAFAALAIAGVLGSPVSWTHHWLWAIPALAWAWSARRWAFWMLATVLVVGPTWLIAADGATTLRLGGFDQIAAAAYVLCGALMLVALASRDRPAALASRDRPAAPALGEQPAARERSA